MLINPVLLSRMKKNSYIASGYGLLYNWYAVDTGLLTPTGWHIPTLSDWNSLISFCGGGSIAGGKLKKVGTEFWNAPNVGATDDYMFSAIGGVFRTFTSGDFLNRGDAGIYGDITEFDSTRNYFHLFPVGGTSLITDKDGKANGLFIRCIKDTSDWVEGETVTDIDGNIYPTVKIGTQVWMAADFRVTKYNNGVSIPNVTNNLVWIALTTGAYCNYNNL